MWSAMSRASLLSISSHALSCTHAETLPSRSHISRWRKDDSRGFTLTEVLAALLVVTMLTALVANSLPVAFRAFEKVQKSSNAQVALTSVTAALRGELTMATDVQAGTGNVVLSYTRADGDEAEIVRDESTGWLAIHNLVTGKNRPLVPEPMAENMGYTLESIIQPSSDSGSTVVEIREMKVKSGDSVLADIGSDGYQFRVLGA